MQTHCSPGRLSFLRLAALALLTAVVGQFSVRPSDAATYIVNNTNDSGGGSLRAQIAGANATPGADDIIFAIPGTGPHTIQPLSPLPTIIDTLEIDGTTQPGYAGSPVIELNGSSAGATADGLTIWAHGCIVRSLAISRFAHNGIVISGGAQNCALKGNYVGTDVSGTNDLGNGWHGIYLTGTDNDTIGGTTAAERNVVSGNDSSGVCADYTQGWALVLGNYIGTDATGTDSVGNGTHGVEARNSSSLYVGGPLAGQGNVISVNNGSGVYIHHNGAYLCRVEGNYIGTDVTGTVPLGNTWNGVYIREASGNQIGETTASARNIISGNGFMGIQIEGNAVSGPAASGNVIEGNYIGTDVTGTVDIGNEGHGVLIWVAAHDNTVGGTTPASRNIISGNDGSGVRIGSGDYFASPTGNLVQGNYIGTDVTGTVPLGNGYGGVTIGGFFSVDNTIGGTAVGAGNLIAHNGWEGVLVDQWPTSTGILGNSIHSNGGLGIDLNSTTLPDGPTLNDSCDVDTGPNNFQNYPILALVEPGPPLTLVDVLLNSTPSTRFRFEFFENGQQDSSGYGEGETFIGWADSTTDGAGNVSFAVFFDPPTQPGHCITATATDPSGNTSEFSPVIHVGEGITLSGQVGAGALELEWSALPGCAGYRIYGAGNDAYFEPDPPHLMFELPPTATTWPNLPAIGDPNDNWTYIVFAFGDYFQEMARSNRFGEHEFSLGGP